MSFIDTVTVGGMATRSVRLTTRYCQSEEAVKSLPAAAVLLASLAGAAGLAPTLGTDKGTRGTRQLLV